MARTSWVVGVAAVLIAGGIPGVAGTGAQASLPSGASSAPERPAEGVSRVQQRSISAPASQWAIIATSGVLNSPRQPAVLRTADDTILSDDTVYVPTMTDGRYPADPVNCNPSKSQPTYSALNPTLAIRTTKQIATNCNTTQDWTATQGGLSVWMTSEGGTANRDGMLIQVGGTVPVRDDTYPLQVRAPQGLVAKDDTVYASYQTDESGNARVDAIPAANPALTMTLKTLTNFVPGQMARSPLDDTLILANTGGNCQSRVIAMSGTSDAAVNTTWCALGAAAGDDSLYLTQNQGAGIAAVNPRQPAIVAVNQISGAGKFFGLAAWPNPSSDDTVFVADFDKRAVWMINGRTLLADDSITYRAGCPDCVPYFVTAARPNLIYATVYTQGWSGHVSAIGVVSGQTSPASSVASPLTGVPDDSITINLTLPELFSQDDSLVTDLWLDDSVTSRAALVRQGNTITAKVPAGTGGPYSVLVGLNGGNRIKVGEFIYSAPTPPTPPGPPTPPAMTPIYQVINGVVGTAIQPTSRFTLENFSILPRYSVYPGLPGGLVIDPTTGVVSGTATGVYPTTRHWITASAGGNSESAYSTLQVTINPAPTPPPPPPVTRSLVLNQGERTRVKGSIHDRITTTGSITGIPAGSRLTPHIRYTGQTVFAEGKATILVQADGTFRWTREIRRNRDVTGYVAYEDLKSNEVTWVRLQ